MSDKHKQDKIYSSMTSQEYHTCITPKVVGTWNLHTASLPYNLEFFTILSSISGVIGQKGQANYAAANSFLDSFATYRQSLNLPASSIDLGVIEDVGYVAEREDLAASFDKQVLTPINERLLHKILRHSILLQKEGGGGGQLITGLVTPQQESSPLLKDRRFTPLAISSSTTSAGTSTDGSKPTRAFFLLLSSQAEHSTLLASAVDLVSAQFTHTLRLSEPVEPGKPLTSYGLDSLAAVEFRNWLRLEMGAVFTMLEVMGATSLFALCEKLIEKVKANVQEATSA
jgi:KR domain/Phosphopantetheine attachment site